MTSRRFQIALACVALIYPLVMSCSALSSSVATLRLICEDDGFHTDCNNKPQVRALAQFNVINSLARSVPMLLANGFLSALADRWGRKPILLTAITGAFIDHAIWLLITLPGGGFFRDNWRIFLPLSSGIYGLFGGMFMIFFCMFAMVADYTRYHPESRSSLFILIEGCMGLGAIVGSQVAGHLLDEGSIYAFTLCTSALGVVLTVAAIALPDVTPQEIKDKKIDWWHANFIGMILVMFPTKRTVRLRTEDAVQGYEDICKAVLASEVGDNVRVPDALARDAEHNVAVMGDASFDGTSSGGVLDAQLHQAMTVRSGGLTSNDESLEAPLFQGELSTSVSAAAAESGLPQQQKKKGNAPAPPDASHPLVVSSPSALQLLEAGIELPHVPPPTSNAIPVLAVSTLFSVLGMIGCKIMYVPFLRQEFGFSNRMLSNLSTLEASFRALGSFVMVPILHRIVRSRIGELRTMQVMFLFMGLGYGLVAFVSERWEVFVAFCLATFASSVPMGFLRGLISTEVGVLLQGRVLAAITVMDIIVSMVAGPVFSATFSATNEDFPGLVYIMAGSCVIASGVAPLLISDTKATFNSRRRRVRPGQSGASKPSSSQSASDASTYQAPARGGAQGGVYVPFNDVSETREDEHGIN